MCAEYVVSGDDCAPIGILGGTFDPIHNGHLRLAMELATDLSLSHVRLVPNGRPPHRDQPVATPEQRAQWIRTATCGEPLLKLDEREMTRRGASYMVDTLATLRADFPLNPLCLIMGRDVFAKLPSWHQWRRLFEYAHIVLIERPGLSSQTAPEASGELENRASDSIDDLHDNLAGTIYNYAPPPLAISASRIRNLLAAGISPRYLLPESVLEDIMNCGIYQTPNGTTSE